MGWVLQYPVPCCASLVLWGELGSCLGVRGPVIYIFFWYTLYFFVVAHVAAFPLCLERESTLSYGAGSCCCVCNIVVCSIYSSFSAGDVRVIRHVGSQSRLASRVGRLVLVVCPLSSCGVCEALFYERWPGWPV